MMRNRLDSITLKGFKTIQALDGFEPGPLTVLIGPNGVGKSNFISFFRMMNWALGDEGGFPEYVARQGGASRLLHDGPDRSREIEAQVTIQTVSGENQYGFRLVHAGGDTLIFAVERYRFSRKSHDDPAPWRGEDEAGHRTPRLLRQAETDQTALVIRNLLRKIIVHQFHDTSASARMRNKWPVHDSRYLKEDAANIAPVLHRLQQYEPPYYQRIVDTIRLILPFFSDFELVPEYGHLLLAWRERGSDRVFDASQASDGMLRIMALVTLLLQPEEGLPDVLILDEPELGLHPHAINVIGGLMHAVSMKVQVIAATQSTALVDRFEPEHVVVVQRDDRRSVFRRLDSEALAEWLEEYSLSELWEKNVLGGRP